MSFNSEDDDAVEQEREVDAAPDVEPIGEREEDEAEIEAEEEAEDRESERVEDRETQMISETGEAPRRDDPGVAPEHRTAHKSGARKKRKKPV